MPSALRWLASRNSCSSPPACTARSGMPGAGPHVMILNIGNRFDGYPTTHDDPKKPFIMYPNTYP
jgi:hypothetical protein